MGDDHHVRRQVSSCRTSTDDYPISYDAAFELLAHQRRRYILYELVDNRTGVMAIDGLTETIANFEGLGHGKPSKTNTLNEIKADLLDQHLPLFVEEELVNVDSRSGILRYRGDPILDRWVQMLKEEDRKPH